MATITKAKLVKDPVDNSTLDMVRLTVDGVIWSVPFDDKENGLYVLYKAWLDAGNTPEAAD